MHAWVVAFCAFNGLRLHEGKTVLIGRNADRSQIASGIININGMNISPLAVGKSVRYLGASIDIDLNYDEQCSKVSSSIGFYCHLAIKYHLPVERAVVFLNSFLMPKLELPLRFVQPSAKQCRQWDSAIGRCLSQLAAAPRVMKAEALAVSLGVQLPSSLERIVKISEAFFSLNSSDKRSAACARARWNAVSHDQRSSKVSRAVRSNELAKALQISFELSQSSPEIPIDVGFPTYGDKFRSRIRDAPVCYVFGSRRLWGSSFSSCQVSIFTAAFSPSKLVDPANQQASGWGICIGDDRLERSADAFLSVRRKLKSGFLAKTSSYGDKIPPFLPPGVYIARLVALMHAILCVPANWDVSIYCAQGAIDALHWFQLAATDRHRLRLCGSSFLGFISSAISARAAAGGSTTLVRYCTDQSTAPALERAGKGLSYMLADLSCSCFGPVKFPTPRQAVWMASCVAGGKPILGQIRKQLRKLDRAHVMSRWASSATQARFCSPAAEIFICRIRALVSDGVLLPHHLGFALRLLTDSIQFGFEADEKDDHHFASLECQLCDLELELNAYHLLTCLESGSILRRKQLHSQLLDILTAAKATGRWIESAKSVPFMAFIRNLFSAFDERGRDDNDRRLRCAFGCFSTDELSGAMATTGISDPTVWPWVDRELRRLLISYSYDEWKRRCAL